MSQPSVTSYFNTRKRSAYDDINASLAKKATVLDNNSALINTIKKNLLANTNASEAKQETTVEELLLQSKLMRAKPVEANNVKAKKTAITTTAKSTRGRKPKDTAHQDIQKLFTNMVKSAPTENEIVSDHTTVITASLDETTRLPELVEDIEQKTPPPSPQKKHNAMDKIKVNESELSLNEMKMKLCRSSRLAELKASMARLKSSQARLEKVEEKTRKIPDSPSLKAFKSIELEVTLSPQKLQSPNKQYLSPRKDTTARKNLLNLLSPSKNAVSISSKTTAASKQLFQTQQKSSLTLPYKYRCLAEIFRCIDTVCQIMYNRKETVTFRKVKPAVEEMLKRTLFEKHLGQIMHIFPGAFELKQEKLRVFGTGKKQEQWELVVSVVTNENGMNSDVLLERRRKLFAILIDKVKEYHEEFLLGLEPPMRIERGKITRWHPEFDIEKVPEIEENPIPQPPNEDKFNTGKEVLDRAKLMFNCNTRMEQALKRLEKARENNEAPAEIPKVAAKPESVLKGIPKALLEKVRQKQAAKALESMTRTDSKDKEVQLYSRLPELCRVTRNLFVSEKKSVLPLDIVLEKLGNSMRMFLSKTDLEDHLKTISREFPKWLVFHELRGIVYIKIAKNADLSLVISKLEHIIKSKTDV